MDIFEKYLNEEPDNTDEFLSDLMELVFEFIDSVDDRQLTEEQQEMLQEILEMYDSDKEDDDEVSEQRARKERVVRGGKRKRKLKCPEGKKAVGGRCVRMSASERRVRSKAAKRGARKRRSKKSSTEMKRKRSLKKR